MILDIPHNCPVGLGFSRVGTSFIFFTRQPAGILLIFSRLATARGYQDKKINSFETSSRIFLFFLLFQSLRQMRGFFQFYHHCRSYNFLRMTILIFQEKPFRHCGKPGKCIYPNPRDHQHAHTIQQHTTLLLVEFLHPGWQYLPSHRPNR